MKSLLATSHSPLAKNLILIPAILLLTMCSSDEIKLLPETWDDYVKQFESSSSGMPTFPFSSSSNPVGNTESSSSGATPISSSSGATPVSSGSILQSSSTVDGILYCKLTNGNCTEMGASTCTLMGGTLYNSSLCDNGSAVSSSSRLSSSSSLISSSSSAPVVPSSSSSVGTCMGQRNLLAYCPGIAWENLRKGVDPYEDSHSNYSVASCYYIVDARRVQGVGIIVNGETSTYGDAFSNDGYSGNLFPSKVDGGYYIYRPSGAWISNDGVSIGYPDCM